MALHEPHQNHQSQKTLSNCKFSACRIESAKLVRVGPNFGPSCTRIPLEPKLELIGPKAIQMDPDLKPCDARKSKSRCATCDPLGTAWAQPRHNMGNIASNEASKYQWKRAFGWFRIGQLYPPFRSHMTSTWAEVALKWVQAGAKLRHLGAKLRHLGAKLGRSWSELGPSWAEAGALLAEVGPKSGQCCGHVGSKQRIWTILVRSAKCANYQSGQPPFGGSPGRTCPPDETAPVWKICPVASAPKLSRLRTFGAGGFDLSCFYIILYYILLYYILLCYIILYYILFFETILFLTLLHCIIVHVISYHFIFYHIILFYIFLYCIILSCFLSYYIYIYITCHIISFHILSFYIISHCII